MIDAAHSGVHAKKQRDNPNPVCELDVRPGGAIRIHRRGRDGIIYPMTGVYQEIVEPEGVGSNALDCLAEELAKA